LRNQDGGRTGVNLTLTLTARARGRGGVAERFAASVRTRDAYTAGHSRRVRRIALAVGEQLGLPNEELVPLGQAALFHDIGKLTIPDEILLKPTSLSEEEWELMRRHSDEGARMIEMVGLFEAAVPAIRHHHERFDGSGYPEGLAGEEIPLGARIIHVADAIDSMLTTRIYRAGRPARQAIAEVRVGAGTQFCPACVEALEQVIAAGTLVDLGINPRSLLTALPSVLRVRSLRLSRV
jgi:putative nucleotidyltransferase with HDIG domain